jgi:hypothetical protein
MMIKYTVAKPFKYGGRVLQPGDEFPGGGKFDDQLIASRMVLAEEVAVEGQPGDDDKPAPRRRTRSKR